jgi:hypothetical protein
MLILKRWAQAAAAIPDPWTAMRMLRVGTGLPALSTAVAGERKEEARADTLTHATSCHMPYASYGIISSYCRDTVFFLIHMGKKRNAPSILHNSGQTAVTIQGTACRRSPLGS